MNLKRERRIKIKGFSTVGLLCIPKKCEGGAKGGAKGDAKGGCKGGYVRLGLT